MSDSKPKLYEFSESCWSNVPKLAISESGFKKDDFEWVHVGLLEGANFNPEYLKITAHGTVPVLQYKGKTYTDSTTIAPEILKIAPHPPPVSADTSTSIIEEIHAAAHDPNATLILPINDQDREAKINGIPKAFLEGRQKALDKYAPDAPEEFKAFLTKKQGENKQLLDFYSSTPDEATKQAIYGTAAQLWKSVGITIRGVVTQALKKNGGPFAGGDKPSEVDFHIITWLSRSITNAGVKPGSSASVAIPKLEEYTGGHAFDPVIGKYWDAWLVRDSFKDNNIH